MTPDPKERYKVRLEEVHTVCRKHIQPFIKYWPAYYSFFSADGFQRILNNRQFQLEVNHRADKMLPHLRTRQICCRLPLDELVELYESIERDVGLGLWPTELCEVCLSVRIGFDFKDAAINKRYRHICFHCFVNQPVVLT